MVQSFKYSFTILKNMKGFLVSMVVMPLVMIVLISLTLAYKQVPVVGYVGGKPNDVNGVKLVELKESDVDYFLGLMQGNLVLNCDEHGNIESYVSTSASNPMISKISEHKMNKTYVDQPSITYSIGILLFKFLTAGGLLATILIQEKRNGILLRIKNSKTTTNAYIVGKALAMIVVYEIANVLILGFYKVGNFDFGNTNVLQVGLVFTIALLISSNLYIYFASIFNNEGHIWMVSTGIIFPLGLVSGILFPVKYMTSWMKVVAKISPLYYLQQSLVNGRLELVPIVLMFVGSLLLACIGMHRLKTKEV